MRPSELADIYARPGPWCTAYVDATAGSVDDKHAADVRPRNVHSALLEQGAATADADAVAEALTPATGEPGEACRLVAACAGRVELDHVFGGPRIGDEIVWCGPIPDLSPEVEHDRAAVRYLLVVVDREGAQLSLHTSSHRRDLGQWQVSGSTENISKYPRGGLSQGHYEDRTEEQWKSNARDVAHEVDHVVGEHAPRTIVVAGDAHARTLLLRQLTPASRELVSIVDENPSGDDGVPDDAVQRHVAARLAEDDRSLLDQLAQRLGGQEGTAVAGTGMVVTALRAAQVESLVVDRDAWIDRTLVALAGEPWIASSVDEGLAVEVLGEVPAFAALTRAAALTGADLTFLPHGAMEHDMAALLRWPVGPDEQSPT